MKATGFIASLALTAALVLTAPVIAHATEHTSAAPSVAVSVVEENMAAALAAASDASFRIQEAALATTAATEQYTIEAEDDILSKRTIEVGGSHISYVDSYNTASAPERGAGLWKGADATDDDSWGYFIGHNPGDFAPVMDLVEGDTVAVCDSDAKAREYTVVDIFDVAEGTYWHEIEQRVSGYGESVILQACCGDGAHYRVVVAV